MFEHRCTEDRVAPQQISAEQLLREAVDRQEPGLQAPTQRFADLEELHEFQGRKRKEFEDYVRRNRVNSMLKCRPVYGFSADIGSE